MSAPETNVPGSPEPAPRKRPRRPGLEQLFDSLQQAAPTLAKLRVNSVMMKLALLPQATFLMGSPASERHHRINEAPVHEVLLTQDFYLGIHPVTQDQYERVMGRNPARFHRTNGGSPDHPVENVSWDDAVLFCKKLSELPAEIQDGMKYRLPTEAEWEYACRGGTTTPFSFGHALDSSHANINGKHPSGDGGHRGTSLDKTSRVGSYPANNFGLFDMHGNVWEWCADGYDESYYAHSSPRDPQSPPNGELRIVRGGSWRNHGATCRSAYRNALVPHNRDPYTGFRVVAIASTPTT